MAWVAHDYFQTLHTPEPLTPACSLAQQNFLWEVSHSYSCLPQPVDPISGPFSSNETFALKDKMPSSAPGPDGIHYGFWKALAARIKSGSNEPDPPESFWDVFTALSNHIGAFGSNRCGFKDANLSMFFKKGDPTLPANYRPISSMNTDCKMYTNLVNTRLAWWAVSHLHPDQKGFVPGRHIQEHTRLASAVSHACNRDGVPSSIVSLDQAKAYDRVDQKWLISVLQAMALPTDLVRIIRDIIHGCRTRVRINSGYSAFYSLRRGVRQGDPLSCLLFNFSIEPLAMRLRRHLSGLST